MMMASRSFLPAPDRHQFSARTSTKMNSKTSTTTLAAAATQATALTPLRLADDETHALRRLARELEREVLHVYEAFVVDHGRRVDSLRWKTLRSQRDLKVYSERDVTMRSINRLQPFFPSGRPPSDLRLGPMGLLASQSREPIKMVSGSIAGTLDDAMYGGAIHDTASLRLRNAYQQRELLRRDSAVRIVLDDASEADPFQFVGLVGSDHESDRDLLLLVQVRSATLRNGERVGVHLYHSILHPQCGAASYGSGSGSSAAAGVVRRNVSRVAVFRQLDDQRVDVFILDVVDADGVGASPLDAEAKALLASSHSICETGVKKKLHWCMRENQRKRRSASNAQLNVASGGGGGGGGGDGNSSTTSTKCHVCRKGVGAGLFFRSSGSLCHLCRTLTCAKCCVSKRIILATPTPAATATGSSDTIAHEHVDTRVEATTEDHDDEETEAKPFEFCRLCFDNVANQSTLEIARADMRERELLRRKRTLSADPRQRHRSHTTTTRTRTATAPSSADGRGIPSIGRSTSSPSSSASSFSSAARGAPPTSAPPRIMRSRSVFRS